jgi:hypothetical protein
MKGNPLFGDCVILRLVDLVLRDQLEVIGLRINRGLSLEIEKGVRDMEEFMRELRR